jgi:predicted enzyme related to lactoylglutathione lyase
MADTEPRSPNSILLTCKNVKESIAFYRDVLGFRVDECWPDESNAQWATMSLGGQTVMIGGTMTEEQLNSPQCAQATPEERALWKQQMQEFRDHPPGVGVMSYFAVQDVDEFHRGVTSRGGRPRTKPVSQFYGIRDFLIEDPSGYRLVFFHPLKLRECQSCGMPLKDAKPGHMYCDYCTDESGTLRPYEQVLEGTTTGYFMRMQGMPRPAAEKAAREHLSKMPAWASRGK